MSRVGRPWSAQIELVEGCTRLCGFCGLNAIRAGKGDYKRMSLGTAERTINGLVNLNPEARIEFAMHGEPTVHPQGQRIVAMFRAALPKAQLMLTTNGATFNCDPKLAPKRVLSWFDAGIDFIVCDTYYPERNELQQALWDMDRTLINIKDFYRDLAPTGWNPYHNHRGKVRNLLVVMDDIGVRDGEHSSREILNHAGSNPLAPVPEKPLEKTCTNPFREITVTWNGEVRICCMDWVGEYVCGNVNDTELGDIWHGVAFEDARAMLQNKNRDFAPCRYCNKNSGSRSGLLPKYPPLTPELISRAQGRGQDRALAHLQSGGSASDAYKKRLKVVT